MPKFMATTRADLSSLSTKSFVHKFRLIRSENRSEVSNNFSRKNGVKIWAEKPTWEFTAKQSNEFVRQKFWEFQSTWTFANFGLPKRAVSMQICGSFARSASDQVSQCIRFRPLPPTASVTRAFQTLPRSTCEKASRFATSSHSNVNLTLRIAFLRTWSTRRTIALRAYFFVAASSQPNSLLMPKAEKLFGNYSPNLAPESLRKFAASSPSRTALASAESVAHELTCSDTNPLVVSKPERFPNRTLLLR